MPKDNHSVLQLYLSGFKSNFYTFYTTGENRGSKLNSKLLFDEFHFLRNKNVFDVINSQRIATENIFKKKIYPLDHFLLKRKMKKL